MKVARRSSRVGSCSAAQFIGANLDIFDFEETVFWRVNRPLYCPDDVEIIGFICKRKYRNSGIFARIIIRHSPTKQSFNRIT